MPIPAGSSPPIVAPSGPLVYDPVLSRVRLTLSGLTVTDSFDRTAVAGDWGTAPTGQLWTRTGGSASDYAVTGTVGRHTHTAANVLHHSLIDVGSTDMTVVADVTIPIGSASGAPQTNWVVGRALDGSNYYVARLDIGVGTAANLILTKRVGGVLAPNLDSGPVGTHSAGATWRIMLNVDGSTVRAKAWLAAGVEPADWQVEATDTDLTVGTLGGLLSRFEGGNTNTLPQSIDWDNVTMTPTVTVERSTDQVRWTTVRGGVVVPSNGALRVDDYEFAPDVTNWYRAAGYIGSLVPTLGGVWLKSIARPFLNQPIRVSAVSEVTRSSRAGVFEVVGRSMPVAVSSVRGSRQWTMSVVTLTDEQTQDLDLLLASGDVLLVQAPAGSRVPSGYVSVGETSRKLYVLDPASVVALPLTEVAAPGPDVVGAAVTCQTVLNTYGTCQQVLNAHPTVLDLLELVGDPTDVLVA